MDPDYYHDISHLVRENPSARVRRIIQSTVIYICAFIAVQYIFVYSSVGVSAILGMNTTADFFGFDDPFTKNQIQQPRKIFVALVYITGPTFCLIIGMLFAYLHSLLHEFDTILKVFALWIWIHCFCLFFGYAITSSFGIVDISTASKFYYGFSVAASWLHLHNILVAPLTIIGIVGAIFTGYWAIRPFLGLSNSRKVAMNYRGRRKLITQVVILPWLIGTPLIMFISLPTELAHESFPIPYYLPLIFHSLASFLMIMGMWFRLDYIVHSIEVHSYDVFKRYPILNMFLLVILILIIQQLRIQELL